MAPNEWDSPQDKYLEFRHTDELQEVLYHLPPEARPLKGEHYLLSSDQNLVQKAISEARKRKGEWARFQVLYELHPLLRFLKTKLEAAIDKGKAPLARVHGLPEDTAFYVFHGQITNQLGQPVLSDFFVIGLSLEDGGLNEKPMPLQRFVQDFLPKGETYGGGITTEEAAHLQNRLPDAIGFAQNFYMEQQQYQLEHKMEEQKDAYEAHLREWGSTSRQQLALELKDQVQTTFVQQRRERAEHRIQTILDEKSQFFQDMTVLSGEAYLKVLAVFIP